MKHKLLAGAGGDVVNLASSGVSTGFADRWLEKVLTERAAEVVARSAESNMFGLGSLHAAIRIAFQVPPQRTIVSTPGATGGIRLVCEQLLAGRVGAEVVVESPVYEPLSALPAKFGAKIVAVERSGGAASVLAAVTERTVAIVLSNLHNPTGQWLDYEALGEICRELDRVGSDALVVVDETFLDLGPQPGTTSASVDPRIVTISSLSKSHGLSPLRCGWVTVDPAVQPKFAEDAVLFDNIGCKLAEVLGALAIEEIAAFRAAAGEHLEANRALVAEWLQDMAWRELVEPQELPAGCIAFPRVIQAMASTSVAERLEAEFGVLVAPGEFFGTSNHGQTCQNHFRLGLGGDRASLERGLNRLTVGLVVLRG
jgi:aspartate/methionine/tyrosine aminotransferase